MGPADYIGRFGETLVLTRFSRLQPNTELPYFWLYPLGEKCETFDYLVELVGAGERTPYFFLQVKTTRKKYTGGRPTPRVRVEVSERDVRRMSRFPAPTYVVAVHEPDERLFLLSVHGDMSKAVSSISIAHELTDDTLRQLWDEVRTFWAARDMTRPASRFTS